MWLDDGWKFRYINRSAQILLHRSGEDLLSKEIWSEYPDLVGTQYEAAYRGAAIGREVRIATEFYQPLATWFEVRAFPAERGVVVLFRDVTKDKSAQEELQRQATYDELTGLYNRREMMRRLEEALVSRPESRIALLFVDLDKFKDINDSYGHSIGDRFLLAIADKLRVVSSSEATVARIGGDEFVMMLEGDREARALNVAEQVIAASGLPISIGDVAGTVGASIGIARYPESARTADELLRNADTAMYEAKRAGGMRARVFGHADAERLVQRRKLRADLQTALECDQFALFYQPQVECGTQRLYGFEALIRWNHPNLGVLVPGQFMELLLASPAYEKTSRWVIRQACRQVAAWHRAGHTQIKVAVNLSAGNIQSSKLVETIACALSDACVEASVLDIEVTETAVMEDFAAAAKNLSQLRRMGVTVSLDDFGTGYSSLAYLTRLPVDCIKIDKSFILGLTSQETCPHARTMIEAMVALARSLDIRTVAEGVETADQAGAVTSLGCDAMQGYWTGRPVSSQVATDTLLGL
jgi:diguanylate cyclase (GGDEF)-like protein